MKKILSLFASIPALLCVGLMGGASSLGKGMGAFTIVSFDFAGGENESPLIPCAPFVGVDWLGNPAHGWPVRGDIAASYCDPAYKARFGVEHWGLDLSVPEGTPAVATMDGRVTRSGYDSDKGTVTAGCG